MWSDGFENLTGMQGMNQLACSVLYHVTKDDVMWYWCWSCEKILFNLRLNTTEIVGSGSNISSCYRRSVLALSQFPEKCIVMHYYAFIWLFCLSGSQYWSSSKRVRTITISLGEKIKNDQNHLKCQEKWFLGVLRKCIFWHIFNNLVFFLPPR